MHNLAPTHLIAPKAPGRRLRRAISVMAWIEDQNGNILLVRQKKDKRLWTLPGGKVRLHEALPLALKRELMEEIGQTVRFSHIVDIFDRPEKNAICVLFRVVLNGGELTLGRDEIEASMVTAKMPGNATPSLNYFWKRHFGDQKRVFQGENSIDAEKPGLTPELELWNRGRFPHSSPSLILSKPDSKTTFELHPND